MIRRSNCSARIKKWKQQFLHPKTNCKFDFLYAGLHFVFGNERNWLKFQKEGMTSNKIYYNCYFENGIKIVTKWNKICYIWTIITLINSRNIYGSMHKQMNTVGSRYTASQKNATVWLFPISLTEITDSLM